MLHKEVYAGAAVAGALVVAAGHGLGLPQIPVALAGVALCVFLRLMGLYRGWKVPTAPLRQG